MTTPAPTSKQIVEYCKARGFLAKQVYVIFTTPTNGIAPVMENLEQHLEYQELLERRGVMFAAGPHWTDDEQHWQGDGLVVVRASSMAEAETIAKQDPMHACGARRYRVRPWLINEGTLSVKLDFATRRFELT
jgi:hypothetical protein